MEEWRRVSGLISQADGHGIVWKRIGIEMKRVLVVLGESGTRDAYGIWVDR